MSWELMNTTRALLDEIADKRCTRKNVALTYAMAIVSSARTDWLAVNKAILARWSRHALDFIKILANKHLEEGEI